MYNRNNTIPPRWRSVLVAGVGFEPTMYFSYNTGLWDRWLNHSSIPQYILSYSQLDSNQQPFGSKPNILPIELWERSFGATCRIRTYSPNGNGFTDRRTSPTVPLWRWTTFVVRVGLEPTTMQPLYFSRSNGYEPWCVKDVITVSTLRITWLPFIFNNSKNSFNSYIIRIIFVNVNLYF